MRVGKRRKKAILNSLKDDLHDLAFGHVVWGVSSKGFRWSLDVTYLDTGRYLEVRAKCSGATMMGVFKMEEPLGLMDLDTRKNIVSFFESFLND